jgi:hypothetical protein
MTLNALLNIFTNTHYERFLQRCQLAPLFQPYNGRRIPEISILLENGPIYILQPLD